VYALEKLGCVRFLVWMESVVMCGLGLGLKPRLGLGFAGLGLHKIVSPAKSQKVGLAGLGLGSSPGLYSYEANPVNIHHHNINMYYYSSPSESTVIKRLSHPIVLSSGSESGANVPCALQKNGP